MGRSEEHVEGYLKRRTEALGGECYKFISGVTGVPDRVLILRGRTVFVETKAEGEHIRRSQRERMQEMIDAGGDVRVASTRTQVDELLSEIMSGPLVVHDVPPLPPPAAGGRGRRPPLLVVKRED